MKKTKESLKVLFTVFCMLFAFSSVSFATTTGIYETVDGIHKIEVKEDGTILYDGAYSLTLTEVESGDKLTGKIGSNKKSVTFYELNDSTWVSYATVTYKHDSVTTYLYEYTAFHLNNYEPIIEENGIYEVWSGDVKVNSYADLQNAISAAESGETVKIISGDKVTSGAYIKDKVITIDGCGNTLDKSSWANSVFVVEKGATLNLENITIDGGAPGFEVDYDAVTFTDFTIPIKENSANEDFLSNVSSIISKGNLNLDTTEIKNNYTKSNGAGIYLSKGNASFVDSKINHNRTTGAGAGIYIGSAFESGQTEYSVGKVSFDNCHFEENYSANGGAIYAIHTSDISFYNTKFLSNTVTDDYGGAIHIGRDKGGGYNSSGHKAGLDFIQVKIDECLFEENWAGNDGFAIENYDAECTITNTTFRKNVGVHPGSSVATFSCCVSRGDLWADQVIENCLFEENQGPASCIGDHESNVKISVIDTNFVRNKGECTARIYTVADSLFDGCKFVDEDVSMRALTFVTVRKASGYAGSGSEGPKLVIRDTVFENTSNGIDVYSYCYKANENGIKTNAIIEGECSVSVKIEDKHSVTIEGNNSGDIIISYDTPLSNAVISEQGNLYGQIINNTLSVTYPSGDTSTTKQIPAEEGIKASPYYIQELLGIEKEGYRLGLYTDKKYTVAWDYVVVKETNLYAKWEEHPTHTLSGEFSVEQNRIVKACECGYFENCLMMKVPENLMYDGNEKKVTIVNDLEIPETDYVVKYKAKSGDSWEDLEDAPINAGSYKAVLILNDTLIIETKYVVTRAISEEPLGNLNQTAGSVTDVTHPILSKVTDGTVTIEYKLSGSGDDEYTETLPAAKGEYTVRLTITGDSNVANRTIEGTLVVEPKPVQKPTSGGSSVTKYKITVEYTDGGTITPDSYRVKKGRDKTFEIVADEGYEIADVLIDGESVGAVESYTFENVRKKHTIEAIFKLIEEEKEEWENPFKDVEENDWFYEAVKYANENGIMNGMTENTFDPSYNITRGMLVTVLYRLENEPTTNKSIPFADVDLSMYYGNAVIWAKQNNIVNGMDENNFMPNASITREQLTTILYRYAKYKGKDISVGENTNILSYDDFSELSEYAIPAMQWACGSGVITGRTESTLAPKGTATRAEVATMIMRFVK